MKNYFMYKIWQARDWYKFQPTTKRRFFLGLVSITYYVGSSRINQGAVFFRIFTVAYPLFLDTVGDSNPAGQLVTLN